MIDFIITSLQLFAIGFGMGIAGPCLLGCAPILAVYSAASGQDIRSTLRDVSYLLTGRLAAYVLLGFLAGISGSYVRQLSSGAIAEIFRYTSGILVIMLGLMLIFDINKAGALCLFLKKIRFNTRNLFLIGFTIGISPCVPLIALLFEIAVMSRNGLHGAFYALFFGLGTFISGVMILGPAAGILSYAPKAIKNERVKTALRYLCCFLLVGFGIFILSSRSLVHDF